MCNTHKIVRFQDGAMELGQLTRKAREKARRPFTVIGSLPEMSGKKAITILQDSSRVTENARRKAAKLCGLVGTKSMTENEIRWLSLIMQHHVDARALLDVPEALIERITS